MKGHIVLSAGRPLLLIRKRYPVNDQRCDFFMLPRDVVEEELEGSSCETNEVLIEHDTEHDIWPSFYSADQLRITRLP